MILINVTKSKLDFINKGTLINMYMSNRLKTIIMCGILSKKIIIIMRGLKVYLMCLYHFNPTVGIIPRGW